jgi:hypothetical protein
MFRKTILSTALLIAGAAQAADFPIRTSFAANARTQGVGRADLPLLRVNSGQGADRRADAIMRKFQHSGEAVTTFGDAKVQTEKDKTVATWADGRRLVAFGDGSKVSFRNPEEINASAPASERMSSAQLEAIGRKFIQEQLSDFIKLGPGEKLEPFSTRVQVGGGNDVNSTERPLEQVLANAIVFTRTVEGVPVLGGGSKVALLVTNYGQVAGFDFDWAAYQSTGKRVKMLGAAQINERAKAMATVKLDSSEVTVKRYECGLFDPGLRRRDAQAAVQGACVIQALEKRIADPVANMRNAADGHVTNAVIDVIPAGETVEADSHWPQAMALGGGRGGDRVMPAGPGPRP